MGQDTNNNSGNASAGNNEASVEKKMKKNPWRSSGPIYISAVVWLIWSLIFPLNGFGSIFLCALTSLSGFGIAKMFWPKEIPAIAEDDEEKEKKADSKADDKKNDKQSSAEKKDDIKSTLDKYRESVKKRPRTGDAAIDKMLDEEELAIAEMLRLDDAIEDTKVSAQIVHLEDVTSKIVSYVVEHPEKRTSVRRFFNYYLPTTLKLLNAYDRMDEAGISGMNIDGTKGKVEEMMDTSLAAFDKQLDALYADEALDISSDIKVMEGLLKQEGLQEDEITSPGLQL